MSGGLNGCAHYLLYRLKMTDESDYPVSTPALRHPLTALRHHTARFCLRFRLEPAIRSHIDTKIGSFCGLIVLILRASKSFNGRIKKFANIIGPSPENARFFLDVANAPGVETIEHGSKGLKHVGSSRSEKRDR